MQKIESRLTLSPLKLSVKLGHSAEERAMAQTVEAEIKIRFATTPLACQSDALTDTLCYHQLTTALQAYCQQRTFKLIEMLTQQLYTQIKQFSPLIDALSVTVYKNPPLSHLACCAFTLSDWT